MKKGLAVIYDPHNLYQFIWYYCNNGKETEWDALCLPNGYKGEYMHGYCEKSGIFKNIIRNDTDYSILPIQKKIKTFIEMLFFYLIGKRSDYCKKILNQFVVESEYAEFVVIADVGVVSGACVALGDERRVVILEDGMSDYRVRSEFVPREKIRSLYMWQGFFLAKMGYCSPGWFRLKTDKNCIKYCSHPSAMKYRDYREIRQLYSDNGTDIPLFNKILKRVYSQLSEYRFEEADILVLTGPFKFFVDDYVKYKRRTENYIEKCMYDRILMKKHPRDGDKYYFGEKTEVVEIDNSIPAEALFPFFQGREVIMTAISSSILCMKSFGIRCNVLFTEGLYEESMKTGGTARPFSYNEVSEFCKEFLGNQYSITKV